MKFRVKILDLVLLGLYAIIMYQIIVLKQTTFENPLLKAIVLLYGVVWMVFFYYPQKNKR